VVRIANQVSSLRDLETNAPSGGALDIDFLGNTRIVNAIIDRRAVEAAAPAPLGPRSLPTRQMQVRPRG
jgi:hypothetical protein